MRYTLLVLFLVFTILAHGQQPSRAELEKRRQRIIENIKQAEEQLANTQQTKKVTMGQLRAIQSKLNSREKLISNINQEIGQIASSVNRSNNEIDKLKGNLEILKKRYAQSVRYAYKSRSSYDMLAFLFSSESFNEAYRRMRYLKRYRDYRKDQAEQIRLTQSKIKEEINSLNKEKAKKDILLSAEEQQKSAIEKEKNETNVIVKQLKGKEKDLLATIQKNRKTAKQIDKAVEDIIRKEMELARKKAEEERRRREEEERKRREEEERQKAIAAAKAKEAAENRIGPGVDKPGTKPKESNVVVTTNEPKTQPKPAPKPVDNFKYGLTPEVNALSSNFENNKGKLPWPVEKGFVSQGFGKYNHPIAEKVVLENNGIDIRTSPGATVRAVYDGSVSKVFTVDGKLWNVLINHGRYYTLYKNLSKVSVKNDQKVSTKQSIGIVEINDDGESVVNFQVWLEGNKMDPELWIAR